MTARLRDGLFFAVLGEAVVLLDICANRYFQLPASLAPAFLIAANGAAHDLTDNDRERLVTSRLLSFDPQFHPPKTSASLPAATCLEVDERALRADSAAIRATMMKLIAKGRLRVMHFATLISRLQAIKSRCCLIPDPCAERAWDIVMAFVTSRQILSDVERCLPSSMALAEALWKAKIPVVLVLGVRLSPFQAHSWVQWDDRVLNDHIDHVRSFKPILVI